MENITKNRLRLGKSWVSMYNFQYKDAPINEIIDVYRLKDRKIYDEGNVSLFHRHNLKKNASMNFLIQMESNGNLYLPHIGPHDINVFLNGRPYIYSFDEHCTKKKCSYYAVTNDIIAFRQEDFNHITDGDLMGENTAGEMIRAYSNLVGD